MSLPITADSNLPDSVATLAQELGAGAGADAYGPLILPQPLAATSSADRAASLCVLAEYGLLAVEGVEAVKFLNGQLTNDVTLLRPDALQYNGYCTPKGRQLASLIEWGDENSRLFAIARDLAAPIAKRLSMYVLRAKAKVRDESANRVALGLLGADLAPALARIGLSLPAAMHRVQAEGRDLLRLNDAATRAGTLQRLMLWLPPAEVVATVGALALPLRDTQLWRQGEIAAGTPRITAATSEAFVPQMINFDLIAGVSFKKGCYPGQEIVARTHYLGKLKRRTQRGEVDAAGAPGDDIVSLADGQPCGKLLMSAASGEGRYEILFEVQTASLEQGGVALAGRPISLLPLPYEIPAA